MTKTKARVLRFPSEHSIGNLGLFETGTMNTEQRPAQGEVRVAEGWEAQLSIGEGNQELLADLSFLEGLGPDDLQALTISQLVPPGISLEFLPRLANLQRLNLSEGTNDHDMHSVGRLTKLSVLTLQSSSITDDGASQIGKLANLDTFRASLPEITDQALGYLAELPLTYLGLDAPAITDDGLRHLGGLLSLNTLSLTSDYITDDGLIHLASLEALHSLSLKCPKVRGGGLASLGSLAELRALSLAGCSIDDQHVGTVVNLKNIQELNLANTLITDDSIGSLAEVSPRLRSITLIGSHINKEARFRLALKSPTLYLDGVRYSPKAVAKIIGSK